APDHVRVMRAELLDAPSHETVSPGHSDRHERCRDDDDAPHTASSPSIDTAEQNSSPGVAV
ncbi:MAG: hypothetical protein QGF59_01775, partial [Pirellulaceae bacterium]|nr:hypothetical protein [Pirellulaceae bacterium]